MLFYDFEVFKEDWLVVIIDMKNKKEHVIINNPEELEKIYQDNINEIWVGFNSRHYDQYILKGILCGFNPKRINDYIILKGNPGWKFSSLFRNIPLNNYDVMMSIDRGLKSFEGFMGNNIKESSVPFDIDRKLTQEELDETVKYCRHDVEQTIEVFLQRKSDFEAHMGLVKIACEGKPLNMALISKTKAQLSAIILEASKREHNDEFDIDFPSTLKIDKYKEVVEWYENEENRCYEKDGKKNQLDIMIAGVPHQFGWGGVHGAIPQYSGEGYFLNMDVTSLYPSLMIQYDLHSRNMKDPQKFVDIYNTRVQYKKEKNPLQLPLKLVLNSTYGVMKDKNNDLFDPLQANRVCIYGQLLILDLVEKLEPHCKIIQSNTDGVLIKMNSYDDYDLIDDIAYEWEQRTHLNLEFDEYRKVFQKDVNNYIIVDAEGHYKSKGAYVKKLNNLDYDLPIINKALVDYMVNNIPVEDTINNCNDLKEFQLVTKISNKYKYILHGEHKIKEKCIRIFASKYIDDPGVTKVSERTGKPAKISNSPEHCFIYNEEVNDVKVPNKLDKTWYINLATKRLNDFGVI
ncbi:hypothetical protein [uncultured Clostridium sp.]|uniref:hypothetical protein n=1 Tax=uncultured Clostridium sp. TaxID=59620 RepID=UPI00260A11D6|nr:hypothetical protein [uncultured Clostridium sp.]